jgi:hypothetical protein
MNASLKYLLRIFLCTALPFGAAMGLFAGVGTLAALSKWPGGRWHFLCTTLAVGVGSAVGAGLFYGTFMALALGGWHVRAVRRLGFPLTDETLAVRQRRTLTLDLSFEEAFRLCTESVRQLKKGEIHEDTDYAAGVILAVKGASWKSWGEKIRFELHPQGNQISVLVECRPALATTIADYGVSLRNMDTIVSFLLAYGTADEAQPAWTTDQEGGRPEGVRGAGRVSDRPGDSAS